jgi:hypothetical protein
VRKAQHLAYKYVLPWFLRRRLSGKAPSGGKASPHLEIRRKAMVAATKTQREKGGGSGEATIPRRRLEVRLWRPEIQRQLVGENGDSLGEDGSDSCSSRLGGGGGEDSAGDEAGRTRSSCV